MRAEFPNRKPDPVFRAAPDGRIIDAGASTKALLSRHELTTAQQLLGDSLWQRILKLQRSGERLPRETFAHVEALEESFIVGHAPSADGAVNVYLTAIDPRTRPGPGSRAPP